MHSALDQNKRRIKFGAAQLAYSFTSLLRSIIGLCCCIRLAREIRLRRPIIQEVELVICSF